jgi:hypothetical protein
MNVPVTHCERDSCILHSPAVCTCSYSVHNQCRLSCPGTARGSRTEYLPTTRLPLAWFCAFVRLCVRAFGSQVYSDQLKNITGFTQDEIQTVASTGNIGLYFAIVAGLVFDNVVSDVPRMPPRVPGVAAHPNTGQRSISWLTS